jgi:hypothetical protein
MFENKPWKDLLPSNGTMVDLAKLVVFLGGIGPIKPIPLYIYYNDFWNWRKYHWRWKMGGYQNGYVEWKSNY